MTRSIRRGRVRLQSYVEPELAQRVDRFCAASGLSESMLVRSSLLQRLDGTGDVTLMLRRFDRLGRAQERGDRNVQIMLEAFALFVQLWFAHTPNLPEDAKRAARMSAESRYRQFVEQVAERLTGGRRFLDDLPQERLADEAELARLAEKDEEPDPGKKTR